MKNLYLLVGPSASGKTTLSFRLERELGMKSVASYTDRPQRWEGELGHIFVSPDAFDTIQGRVADNSYAGYRYAATQQLLDDSDIYVVEPCGHAALMHEYRHPERLRTIFLNVPEAERERRMRGRGDSETAITSRLSTDLNLYEGFEQVADCVISGQTKEATFQNVCQFIFGQENN